MEEQTVNEPQLFDASDIEPTAEGATEEQAEQQPDSAVEATKEQTTSEGQEASNEPAATAKTGDAIDEFLAKKGIKADDPQALRKVAEMYRNVEKSFYNKSQENAQLTRRLSEAQLPEVRPDYQALSEVRAMRTEIETERWKQEHNLSEADEAKMVDYLNIPLVDSRTGQPILNPATGLPYTKATLVHNGSLTLDDVYTLSGAGKVEVDNLKENLRAEVLKEMEARQAAKRPAANATNSTQFGKPDTDDAFASALLGD
jgi:hypothetical protein